MNIFQSDTADGSSAIAFKLNNSTTLSTLGAKLLSLQNNSFEEAYIDRNGIGVLNGLGLGTYPGEIFHILGGNILVEGSGETAIKFKRDGSVGTDSNPIFQIGRIIDGGINRAEYRVLASTDTLAETPIFAQEITGTAAFLGTDWLARSRIETYDGNGAVNPTHRVTSSPQPGYEVGRGAFLSNAGTSVRASNVVTVTTTVPHLFSVGDVLSRASLVADTNFPGVTNGLTVASVPSGSVFTYAETASNAASAQPLVYSIETEWKLRNVSQNVLDLVCGVYGSEQIKMTFYADSMVTSSGYGASYGGSVIYQPTIVNHAASPYSLASGSVFLSDASGGAVTFNLAAANSYYGKPGRQITVKKIDSSGNAVTVTAAGSDKIDGSGTYALSTQYKYVTLLSDGSANWYVLANN